VKRPAKATNGTLIPLFYRHFILLALPVIVAAGERSFSKLIRNYLRSSMKQDRLNSVAFISTENENCDIVYEFSIMKSGKAK
jgi:hypothetical protein